MRLAIIVALVAAGSALGQTPPLSSNSQIPQISSPHDCMTCGTGAPLPFTCVLCDNTTTNPLPFQGGTCEPGYTLLWRQDYSAVCAKDLRDIK